MRVSLAENAVTRRAALALSAWALAASTPPAAHARVDGIPLYAPGDQVNLPKAGFEYWLPRVEALQTAIPSLRLACTTADWPAAAQLLSSETIAAQLSTLGGTASILGDDAYTAIGIKQRWAQAAKRLQGLLIGDKPPNQQAALQAVAELELCVQDMLALIPPSVVRQVRELEKKRAELAS